MITTQQPSTKVAADPCEGPQPLPGAVNTTVVEIAIDIVKSRVASGAMSTTDAATSSVPAGLGRPAEQKPRMTSGLATWMTWAARPVPAPGRVRLRQLSAAMSGGVVDTLATLNYRQIMSRAIKRAAILSGTSLLSVILPTSPAAYGNWYGATGSTGPCNGNMQDNSTVTWHRTSGLSPEMMTAVSQNMWSNVDPTDLTVQAELGSPDGNTDIVYNEADYVGTFCGTYTWHSAGSVIGLTQCMSLSGSKCQRFDIYTDRSWEINATTTTRLRHACHEIGHALGLSHPSGTDPTNTCMATDQTMVNYSNHEIKDHINANY